MFNSMSKKTILILCGLVTSISVIVLFSYFKSTDTINTNPDPTDENGYSDFNSWETVVVDDRVPLVTADLDEGKLTLSDEAGNPYLLNGRFGSSSVTELDKGFFQLFKEDDPQSEWFDIFYDEPSGSITVFLYQEPLREARLKATTVLVSKLNTQPDILCQLNITVITNEYINSTYAGQNLGLSICPDAIALP
jgi:hypothetical protein